MKRTAPHMQDPVCDIVSASSCRNFRQASTDSRDADDQITVITFLNPRFSLRATITTAILDFGIQSESPMYRVIGTVKSRALRVMWMLEELDQDYELITAPPRSDVARQ